MEIGVRKKRYIYRLFDKTANTITEHNKKMMETNKRNVEEVFKKDLHQYLTYINRVDERLPEAPDLENLWSKVGESYLPDAIREFGEYPTVALGWIMFVGMALAKYWDEDWELYSKVADIYKYLRDSIDFDHMDDYICEKVLLLNEADSKALSAVVAECASRTYNLLIHQGLQPGSEEAFCGFVAALHQMYLMGVAIELKALGYHMAKL